jgi:uncharacterized membrane protein
MWREAGEHHMKKLFNRMKTSIWLYPALYSAGSLLLSVLISFIDTRHAGTMSRYVHDVLFTSAPLAQAILGIIASAFITIATFTFSTAMVVLTMYSSSSPGVVVNFPQNQHNMKSLAVFLSCFSILSSCCCSRYRQGKTWLLAAGVGVLKSLVGVGTFWCLSTAFQPTSRPSGLIQRLQREAASLHSRPIKVVGRGGTYPVAGLAALAVI